MQIVGMLSSARLYLKDNQLSLLISLAFAIVYSLIVFYNHHCFRTFALDLGVYTNALYDYSHLQWNDAGVFKTEARNLLSDHLDLSLILIAPFSLLFGQYTLLLMQILFVLAGGFGIYKLVLLQSGDKTTALFAQTHFLLFFSVFSALSFDYHSNVLAAVLIPWLMHKLHRKQYLQAVLLFLLMLTTKESTALLLMSLSAGLFFEFRKDIKTKRYLLLFFLFSLLYFVLAIMLVMPALTPGGQYGHYKYHALGNSYAEAFRFVLAHPINTLKLMFVNHSGNPVYDWVKTEFYLFLCFSGFVLLLFRPWFILMLGVSLLAKMCYDDPAVWSIDAHYAIEFAVLVSIGSALVISKLAHLRWRRFAQWLLLISTFAVTLRLMDHTVYKHDYLRLRIYQAGHYKRGHNIKAIHNALKRIPANAAVSAQSPILPHLAYRDTCYQLPIVRNARYIIASRAEPVTYPMQKQELIKLLNDSIASGRWTVLVDGEDVTLLKRK